MAKKLEQWAARDGSIHGSAEQADARDNDLTLIEALSNYTQLLYSPINDAETAWRRMEQQGLVMALFAQRKPLLDVLLRHNAGPTLRPLPAPPVAPAQRVLTPAPATATDTLPKAPEVPLELTAAMEIPSPPKGEQRAAPENSIPDNFRFGGKP
jgi:hypothetical protein